MDKTNRNEPCWCGSGKKYKKCHYLRSNEEPHSIGRLLAELKTKKSHKQCLHPDASQETCTSKIIDAHSIQKNGPLKHVADETNHVYTFGIDTIGKECISKIGLQKASTFKGFCSLHDKSMFSPIEDEIYNGSSFQCFLAGYRAYALEYFKKISAVKGLPFMRENVDRGMSVEQQLEVQITLNSMLQGFSKGLDDFKKTLDIYTNHYKLCKWDEFNSASFYFTGDLSLAVSGTFSPDFSLAGERLQMLTPNVQFVENLSINTLTTKNGYAIVFSWPKVFKKCTRFVESLSAIDKNLLPSRLIELIFSYIENVYFSKTWVDGLPKSVRVDIEKMARNPIQYGKAVCFTGNTYTNWEIAEIIYNL